MATRSNPFASLAEELSILGLTLTSGRYSKKNIIPNEDDRANVDNRRKPKFGGQRRQKDIDRAASDETKKAR